MTEAPGQGDLFLALLGQGQEQGGKRPCLVVSDSVHNRNALELLVVLPVTTRRWELPMHVRVSPAQSGLGRDSYIMCDQPRTITRGRLLKHLSRLDPVAMGEVKWRLRALLDLP